MFNWFNALVTAAVIVILAAAGGNAVMGHDFDALSLAGATMLLLLPILYRLASRRPKPFRRK
jgi:uncharacterized membrane protein YfcA